MPTPPETHPAHAAHRAPRRKLRFAQIVEAIRRQREAAWSAEEADPDAPEPDAMDRRVVLAKVCAELDVDEELLLLRGFDRAYRLVVEGV